jgi:transcriptional regulator with XRE-family HTH domain
MPSKPLPHLLCAARKRRSLEQREVAFLIGSTDGSRVSRYETFERMPELRTALAFELIYGRPVGELFAGLREEVAEELAPRAKILRHRIRFRGNEAGSVKRREAVDALVSLVSVKTPKS